jgi:LytTr DNA-binding domain
MTSALLFQDRLRVGLTQAPLAGPAVVSTALAALYCAGCAWLVGEQADWWRVSLPWAVAVVVPWAAALGLARELAMKHGLKLQTRVAAAIGIGTLLALAAWILGGLLEALLLPHGYRSALLASYERSPLVVPAAIALSWVLLRRESGPQPTPAPNPAPNGIEASVESSACPTRVATAAGVEVRATNGLTCFVPWVEVLAIEAAGNYVELVTQDRRWLLRRPLQSVESELLSVHFCCFERVHRGALVNTGAVRALRRKPDGGGTVVLSNGHEVPASRRRWPELRRRLATTLR